MIIQLSDTAEILLQRILNKKFRLGIKSHAVYESMIEHLIIEEARKLKVTDDDIASQKACSRPQTSASADDMKEARK